MLERWGETVASNRSNAKIRGEEEVIREMSFIYPVNNFLPCLVATGDADGKKITAWIQNFHRELHMTYLREMFRATCRFVP